MLALTAPRVRAFMTYYDRKLELTESVFKRSNAILAKALAGNAFLTRNELAPVLESAGITASVNGLDT